MDQVIDGLLYTKEHEWMKVNGAFAVIGISDHAQSALGDVTFVELPKVGISYKKGDECAVVESVKAASDVYAPAAGKVVKVNAALETTPECLNRSPYGDGWLCEIELSAPAEGLLSADAYRAYLNTL
jgi:glycine cleavage system H protein